MRTIDAAIDELLRNPQETVLAEVRGVVVEVRLPGERTADDPFREARVAGGSKPPVPF